jgi:AbrB family looped-hinge helix DNA binding protein
VKAYCVRKRASDETVKMSSKGQIVIPARVRRQLGLKAGRVLRLHAENARQITLTFVEDAPGSLDDMLQRSRSWKSPVDELEQLRELRQRDRNEEVRRRERGGY